MNTFSLSNSLTYYFSLITTNLPIFPDILLLSLKFSSYATLDSHSPLKLCNQNKLLFQLSFLPVTIHLLSLPLYDPISPVK